MWSCLPWALAGSAPRDGRPPLCPERRARQRHEQGFRGLLEVLWPGDTEAQRGAGT